MEGMESVLTILAVMGGAVLAFVFGKGMAGKKASKASEPPKNRAAEVATETIQRSFEEEVENIAKDAEGDDPAGDLANRGNARRRR